MIWKILAAPVLGAVIGYCTNWLAVKMLFRPRTEKYIGKFRVPFTPGVIPKGKKRLAAAVSEVINKELITKEALEAKLLAPEVTYMLRTAVNERLAIIKNDETKTLGSLVNDAMELSDLTKKEAAQLSAGTMECAKNDGGSLDDQEAQSAIPQLSQPAGPDLNGEGSGNMPELNLSSGLNSLSKISVYENADSSSKLEGIKDQVKDFLTARIFEKVSTAGLGDIAADAVNTKLNEVMAGSLLAQMMGGSFLMKIAPAIAQTVDGYINENGEAIIRKMVSEETDSIMELRAGNLIEKAEETGFDAGGKVTEIYTAVIKRSSEDILKLIDAGGIAASAIENMDNEQLEKIVLATMKTELGAVVNLGALIGLLLGLINMIIYLM